MHSGQLESALQLFETSMEFKDSMPFVLYGKAVACASLGRIEDARGALIELLEREPTHANGQELLRSLPVEAVR